MPMPPKYISPPQPQEFRLNVWEAVKKVPAGKVVTYGQIAAMIPTPEGVSPQEYRALGARWVGGAMSACPAGVPWQRVINSQGKISLSGANAEQQRLLLEAEGISFDEKGRINLKFFQWHPSD